MVPTYREFDRLIGMREDGANAAKSISSAISRRDGKSGDKAHRELKIRVSVAQFRPWAPLFPEHLDICPPVFYASGVTALPVRADS